MMTGPVVRAGAWPAVVGVSGVVAIAKATLTVGLAPTAESVS
jgi:hypothetical protein